MTTGSFLHDNLVLYIGSLPNLATWFPYGRGRTLFILGSLPLYRFIIYIDRHILWCTHFLLLYTVTDRNIPFSGTTVTYYLLSFGNLAVNPVHFLLTEKYQKGQSMYNYIILLFNLKYKCWWFIVIFLLDKHNINAVS